MTFTMTATEPCAKCGHPKRAHLDPLGSSTECVFCDLAGKCCWRWEEQK